MNFDMLQQPYPSNRYPVMARNGMVCTGCSLASEAGLEILRQGGNAVDAAIATAAALTVVEPTANGLGSDSFAIVYMNDQLYGMNASGRSCHSISIDKVKALHPDAKQMPTFGWTPVTVPGAVGGWAALNKRWGKLSLEECLQPAIRYAQQGYPCTPVVSRYWQAALKHYKKEFGDSPEFAEWFKTFAPNNKAPQPGDLVKLPNHANTLIEIGKTQGESFYRGKLAEEIEKCSRKHNGFLRKIDLAAFQVEWVEPLRQSYHGYQVCEIPPNGQGIVALMALNILKEFLFSEKMNISTIHHQCEAMKMAFKNGLFYITDPQRMKVKTSQLLDPQLGKDQAKKIQQVAINPEVTELPQSGTVYLCTADKEGNMVSYIQSNYMGFGSGIVVEGTGIAMQNRGHDFSLEKGHANSLEPNKKTYHTIIPGFLMKDKKAVGPFGVMGGYMQPQGHVQVVMNLIDFNLNPQMALDAPRWCWIKDKKIRVEQSFPSHLVQGLKDLGHDIEVTMDTGLFGRGQMIIRMENGTLVGGCESRTDSNIASY